jgi:hypothetical protein
MREKKWNNTNQLHDITHVKTEASVERNVRLTPLFEVHFVLNAVVTDSLIDNLNHSKIKNRKSRNDEHASHIKK